MNKVVVFPALSFSGMKKVILFTIVLSVVGLVKTVFAYSYTSTSKIQGYTLGLDYLTQGYWTLAALSEDAAGTNSFEVPLVAYGMAIGSNSGTTFYGQIVQIGSGVFPASVEKIKIGENVKTISSGAFLNALKLEEIEFLGDAPTITGTPNNLFQNVSRRLIVKVPRGSIGWDGGVSSKLPETWYGRAIMYSDQTYDWDTSTSETKVNLVTTNVVMHYVVNSVQPSFAFPVANDMGFVNIITEVKSGGVASIPITWAMSYPNYNATFGTDFTASLMKTTGKKDAAGNDLRVWQDYVAGTDPTNPNDVFTATITIVEGKPVISYSPELDEERKALREYTFYGKKKLTDGKWDEVAQETILDYNFFKVTVEMK